MRDAPQRIGPYALEGELGRGAMGVVHRARHVDLGREVALKVIDASHPAASVDRFRREAATLARIGKHPHVVTCFEVGEAEGRIYLAMELVEGEDLAKVVARRGPLPEKEALEIARKAALAVAHAHARGIVHRDLKPSNILLDAQGEPQVTDFGLALDRRGERLTAEGDALGTPEYMAPEQARGDRSQIGPWTDVYGLGATLYDLLAGRPLFTGSALGVIMHVLLDDPPLLSEVRPDASAAAGAIVCKATEKEPQRRYQTALEMADDLQRALSGATPRARPFGVRDRFRRLARRHRAVVVTAAVLLGLLAIVVGAGLVQALRARARRAEALHASLEAAATEDASTKLARLGDAISLDPSWPRPRVELALACYERALERYRDGDLQGYERDLRMALAATAEVQAISADASMLLLEGTVREWLGETDGAAQAYGRAAEADPQGPSGITARAALALSLGRLEEAEEALGAAIEASPGEGTPRLKRSAARLALSRLEGALADAEAGVRLLWRDDWSLCQRARVRLARGEARLAGEDLLAALEAAPTSAAAHLHLARLAAHEGDAARAAALEARAKDLGADRLPAWLTQAFPLPALASIEDPRPLLEEARDALAKGAAALALDRAGAALSRSPASAKARSLRAESLRRLGRAAEADVEAARARSLSGVSASEAPAGSATALAPPEAAPPVTVPNGSSPASANAPRASMNDTEAMRRSWNHGNGALWVVVPPGGILVADESDRSPDGEYRVKFGWWRGVPGRLEIEGRRFGGAAPPLRSETKPESYGDLGFIPSELWFPADCEGLWEVTGRIGERSLHVVLRVAKAK